VPEPGNPQALNRYAYALNNPLRYADPTGHCPQCLFYALWETFFGNGVSAAGGDLYDPKTGRPCGDTGCVTAHKSEAQVVAGVALDVAVAETGGRAVGKVVQKGAGEVATQMGAREDVARAAREAVSHTDEATKALRRAENVADAAGSSLPVVIGENMDRVRRYAEQIGGQTINDFVEDWSMEANENWIRQMRAAGKEIIDIGPDFQRRLYRVREGIRPDASAYNLERQVLQGYEWYRRAFQRMGKYWGGVPGFD